MVTAFCRIFARRNIRVAPFKAQNMSNNAAVCPDGSEIGRAQAVQALAAGIPLSVDLNPILIKPEADSRSQVIVNGRPFNTLSADAYYNHKDELWKFVTASLDRLRQEYELVIVEGAGSPVELNLKSGDMVNTAVAIYTQSPIILVGDIDRGGIFAQLLGTLWLLEPEERGLVRGVLVNKFRGDLTLFQDGISILEERGGVPVLGVVPFLKDLHLPEEDAVVLEQEKISASGNAGALDIAVIHLPRISNFDDFDPLAREPGVNVRYVDSRSEFGNPDAIILPGTKSTVADLEWLRSKGLAEKIIHYAQNGGALVGLCGGYQMLGKTIRDPQRVETGIEYTQGLGLLENETEFFPGKATFQATGRIKASNGWLADLNGTIVEGYEIHAGQTNGGRTWLEIESRNRQPVRVLDGAISQNERVWGCYLHGLFANSAFRHKWLRSLGWQGPEDLLYEIDQIESDFDRLADEVEAAVDIGQLEKIVWEN
jgi:adenosylcobyric acid synthase